MAECETFGTFHVDRPSKVKNELSETADDADILFIESPRGDDYKSELRIRNPAFYLTGVILKLLWGTLGLFLTGQFDSTDGVATKKVARDKDLDIEAVDMNIPRRMSEVHPAVTVFSWLWAMMVIILFTLGVWEFSATFLLSGFLLGFIPSFLFSHLKLSERDEVMAGNIETILSADDGINKGCLVAGGGHIDGVEEQLEETSVEVSGTFKSKWLRYSLYINS